MKYRLSICIATYNRGSFIAETLDSILSQINSQVELIVVDGASTDNTSEIMREYQSKFPVIRYFREQENSGVDHDFDKAVGYATGDYCWLMSDDDLLQAGAVSKVLSSLDSGDDLLVVNAEIRNAALSDILLERRLPIFSDRRYGPADMEQFFVEVANYLSFIGCVVIRRSFWLDRDRRTFYGTLFIHVCVLFQRPAIKSAYVISDPLITIRDGNATWASRTFEVWAVKWPDLIWSFPEFSDEAKVKICFPEQWRRFKFLFYHRAMGTYSITEYQKYLSSKVSGSIAIKAFVAAIFPGTLANLIVVLYYILLHREAHVPLYDVLHSRHAGASSRFLASTFGRVPEK